MSSILDTIEKLKMNQSQKYSTFMRLNREKLKEYIRIDRIIEIHQGTYCTRPETLTNSFHATGFCYGKFLDFIVRNKLFSDPTTIDHELHDNQDPLCCSYIRFADKFPIHESIENEYKECSNYKQFAVFYILQYCYKSDAYPDLEYIHSRLYPLKLNMPNISKNIQQNEYVEKYAYNVVSINEKLSDCAQLKRLALTLSLFAAEKHDIDEINIKLILEDYLYLLHNYHSHDNFEYTYNKLGGFCDKLHCNKFKRNTRNRSCNDFESTPNYRIQIMDKIHCYYRHCFDCGHRVKVNGIKIPNDSKNEIKIPNEQHLTQQLQMNNINTTCLKDRSKYKYNNINNETIKHENKNMYHFGYLFDYEYAGQPNPTEKLGLWTDDHEFGVVHVSCKHSSLKEELTQNIISTLNVAQFNNEYKKALTHFHSNFCKHYYQKDNQSINHFPQYGKIIFPLTLSTLLSLMIYCNYTVLQYEFSKTYREHNGKHHDNFYWLGKYLQLAVHKFGTEVNKGSQHFYHGIGERLFFPHYNKAFMINCPLSTTSSFAVATSFANNNNGLILQFYGHTPPYYYSGANTYYFSVSWLSDYGNENEYLFIQGAHLYINNIVDTTSGYEFGSILNALQCLNAYTRPDFEYPEIDTIQTDENIILQSMSLFVKIVSDRLVMHKSDGFLKGEYVKNICDTSFEYVTKIFVDYRYWKTHYSGLFKLFCFEKYEWVNISLLNALFKNLKEIHIKNIKLSLKTLNNILFYFSNNVSNDSLLLHIKLIEGDSPFIFKEKSCNMVTANYKYQQLISKITKKYPVYIHEYNSEFPFVFDFGTITKNDNINDNLNGILMDCNFIIKHNESKQFKKRNEYDKKKHRNKSKKKMANYFKRKYDKRSNLKSKNKFNKRYHLTLQY
eukprot:342451_1